MYVHAHMHPCSHSSIIVCFSLFLCSTEWRFLLLRDSLRHGSVEKHQALAQKALNCPPGKGSEEHGWKVAEQKEASRKTMFSSASRRGKEECSPVFLLGACSPEDSCFCEFDGSRHGFAGSFVLLQRRWIQIE
jgi:hypothetical protein